MQYWHVSEHLNISKHVSEWLKMGKLLIMFQFPYRGNAQKHFKLFGSCIKLYALEHVSMNYMY